jgi:steroid 5-alpha reductase family enzyme
MLKSIIGIVVAVTLSTLIALAGSSNSNLFNGMPIFMLCASVGFVLHWLGFIPAYLFQTEHYFDLIGSISYVATVALAFILVPSFDARGLVVATLICVWAVRLGSFLFIRVKKAGQDRRFTQIKTKFFRFLLTWTLGGTWVFMTMASGLAAMTSQSQSPVDAFLVIGTAMWALGFVIEVIADRQKTIFRKDPANAEKFISSGLWSISRHPNYLGEIILWIGIAIIALPVLSGWQWITLISPAFVIFLLLRVSGVPLLEKNAESRWGNDPEFRRYKARTPSLIPYFGKGDLG